MADVQIENGYTKIANELLEAFSKKEMSGRAFRCVLAIIRETYGWNRKEAILSNYKLSSLTGIAPQHVFSVTKELESIGVISRIPNSKGTVISLNKDYEKWFQSIPENGITENGNTENGNTNLSITSITENGYTGITENGNTDTLPGLVAEPMSDTPKERLKKEKEITPAKESKPKKAKLTAEEFIQQLKTCKAYKGIDIDRELGKMDMWLLTPNARNQTKTRRFILGWLNRYSGPLNYVEPEKFCTPTEVAEIHRKETEAWKEDQARRKRESPLNGLTPDQIAEKFKETMTRMMNNEPKLQGGAENDPA